jgi:hypothetical protein
MASIWDERRKGLEEEYFRRQDQVALEKTRRRLAAIEREHLTVVPSRCPKCRGELEKPPSCAGSRSTAALTAEACGLTRGGSSVSPLAQTVGGSGACGAVKASGERRSKRNCKTTIRADAERESSLSEPPARAERGNEMNTA